MATDVFLFDGQGTSQPGSPARAWRPASMTRKQRRWSRPGTRRSPRAGCAQVSRVILTSPVTIPASAGQPAVILPEATPMEVTAARPPRSPALAAPPRAVSAMSATAAHDQLGEAVGVSNSSA